MWGSLNLWLSPQPHFTIGSLDLTEAINFAFEVTCSHPLNTTGNLKGGQRLGKKRPRILIVKWKWFILELRFQIHDLNHRGETSHLEMLGIHIWEKPSTQMKGQIKPSEFPNRLLYMHTAYTVPPNAFLMSLLTFAALRIYNSSQIAICGPGRITIARQRQAQIRNFKLRCFLIWTI